MGAEGRVTVPDTLQRCTRLPALSDGHWAAPDRGLHAEV